MNDNGTVSNRCPKCGCVQTIRSMRTLTIECLRCGEILKELKGHLSVRTPSGVNVSLRVCCDIMKDRIVNEDWWVEGRLVFKIGYCDESTSGRIVTIKTRNCPHCHELVEGVRND